MEEFIELLPQLIKDLKWMYETKLDNITVEAMYFEKGRKQIKVYQIHFDVFHLFYYKDIYYLIKNKKIVANSRNFLDHYFIMSQNFNGEINGTLDQLEADNDHYNFSNYEEITTQINNFNIYEPDDIKCNFVIENMDLTNYIRTLKLNQIL